MPPLTVTGNDFREPDQITGPELIDISISPTIALVGEEVTMTVTAKNQVGINEISARWQGEIPESKFDISCDTYPVSTAAGTVTCTGSKVIAANHYSGTYSLSDVHVFGSEPYPWQSGYGSDGTIRGPGQGGVYGEMANSCCHSVNMPPFVVK
jgi:hypothetical protein